MKLDFKPVVAGDIEKLKPFYGLRPNKACDSVFLDCFLWKDYYHVECAVSEDRAALWLMERDGQVSTAMPMCREEDLPYFFHQLEEYFLVYFLLLYMDCCSNTQLSKKSLYFYH